MKFLRLSMFCSLVAFISLQGCTGQSEDQTPEAAMVSVQLPSQERSVAIVPRPARVALLAGAFQFNRETVITVSSEKAMGVAEYWRDFFSTASGIELVISEYPNSDSSLHFHLTSEGELGSHNPEAYRLTADESAISIEASSTAGLFYGLQTLRWMLPHNIDSRTPQNNIKWYIPAIDIIDEPRFSWRGMHLDVSRSYMPVWFIKRYIDLLALHKMNRFHWHLTDDQGWRVPIDTLPLLIEKGAWRNKTVVGHTLDKDVKYDGQPAGGHYSKSDIREIVRYATRRHITVIPEIDVPGHASALLHAYPEFGCSAEQPPVQPNFGIFLSVLCPTEETFAMLDKVFAEVSKLFPGPYIHIGGDEVRKDEWEQSEFVSTLMREKNLSDYHEVQSYFIGRVNEIVAKHGRKIIGWNEILDGGIAAEATIMSWQGIKGGIEAARLGHDAIMTPFAFTYFDFYQSRSLDEPMAIHGLNSLRNTYSYNPMPEELKGTEKAKHILGVQGQLWTEYQKTPSAVEYMLLPRMSALAEIGWTAHKNLDWGNFTSRLSSLFQRFSAMRLNYSRSAYAVAIDAEVKGIGSHAMHDIRLSSDIPSHQIRYTTDGTAPTIASPVYKKAFTVAGGTLVRVSTQDVDTGEMYSETSLRVVKSKAVGREIKVIVDGEDTDEPGAALVDGISSVDQVYHADEWIALNGKEIEFVIGFSEEEDISSIRTAYNPAKHRQMYEPSQMILFTSNDGKQWRKIENISPILSANTAGLEFSSTKTRWLKLVTKNEHLVLDRQTNKVGPVALLFSEIVVN